jgi:hypothetical protein
VKAVLATEERERCSDSGRRGKRDSCGQHHRAGDSNGDEHLRCRAARQEHDTSYERARDEDGGDGGCYRRTSCA